MRGPLIALTCGLAAAALVVLVWRGGGEPQTTSQPAPVARAPASAPASAANLQPQAEPPVTAAPARGAVAIPSPVAAEVARPPVLPQASSAAQSTFALSSDHRTLIQGTLLAAADFDQLESEPRDDAWATETERLIRQELARHGSAVDFDVITVDCRQTLCAIQAFSNGENGHRHWVEAVDELYKEALASTFDSVNTAFPTQGSSRSPVLTFLHRRPVAPKG
jgi:hypothetical protein